MVFQPQVGIIVHHDITVVDQLLASLAQSGSILGRSLQHVVLRIVLVIGSTRIHHFHVHEPVAPAVENKPDHL